MAYLACCSGSMIFKNDLVLLMSENWMRFEVDTCGFTVLNGVHKLGSRRHHTKHNIVLARYSEC